MFFGLKLMLFGLKFMLFGLIYVAWLYLPEMKCAD